MVKSRTIKESIIVCPEQYLREALRQYAKKNKLSLKQLYQRFSPVKKSSAPQGGSVSGEYSSVRPFDSERTYIFPTTFKASVKRLLEWGAPYEVRSPKYTPSITELKTHRVPLTDTQWITVLKDIATIEQREGITYTAFVRWMGMKPKNNTTGESEGFGYNTRLGTPPLVAPQTDEILRQQQIDEYANSLLPKNQPILTPEKTPAEIIVEPPMVSLDSVGQGPFLIPGCPLPYRPEEGLMIPQPKSPVPCRKTIHSSPPIFAAQLTNAMTSGGCFTDPSASISFQTLFAHLLHVIRQRFEVPHDAFKRIKISPGSLEKFLGDTDCAGEELEKKLLEFVVSIFQNFFAMLNQPLTTEVIRKLFTWRADQIQKQDKSGIHSNEFNLIGVVTKYRTFLEFWDGLEQWDDLGTELTATVPLRTTIDPRRVYGRMSHSPDQSISHAMREAVQWNAKRENVCEKSAHADSLSTLETMKTQVLKSKLDNLREFMCARFDRSVDAYLFFRNLSPEGSITQSIWSAGLEMMGYHPPQSSDLETLSICLFNCFGSSLAGELTLRDFSEIMGK